MISTIRTKIRSLVEDFTKTDIEAFEYETSSIFPLSEPNITSIDKVSKNEVELSSGDYSYDSTTNTLEVTASLSAGDIITVNYTYSKYSDSELNEYIRASLVQITIHTTCSKDFEFKTTYIYPTPSNREQDLIAMIGSILINPNWSEKRLPNLIVRYPRTMTREDRIRRIVNDFYSSLGVNDTLEFDY